jgi:hypothetical protein
MKTERQRAGRRKAQITLEINAINELLFTETILPSAIPWAYERIFVLFREYDALEELFPSRRTRSAPSSREVNDTPERFDIAA